MTRMKRLWTIGTWSLNTPRGIQFRGVRSTVPTCLTWHVAHGNGNGQTSSVPGKGRPIQDGPFYQTSFLCCFPTMYNRFASDDIYTYKEDEGWIMG